MFSRVLSCFRIIIPIVLQLTVHTGLFAHKEYVHQYLAIEAYRLLETRYPSLSGSQLREHLGTQGGDCAGMPFTTGLITTGAYREDCEDPVFHYGDVIPFLDNAYFSASHFWDADRGDRSTIEICDITCGRFENAYQKSLRYVLPGSYGRWTAKLSWPVGQAYFNLPGGGTTWIVQYGQIGFEYDDLTAFYRDGVCRITGYNDITGRWQTGSTLPDRLPIEVVAPHHVRDRIAWEVVGRIAHLLGDLGVPAHSHNDIHPPFWWNNEPADIFEEEMGALYTAWDHLDAAEQGGILDLYDAVKTDDDARYLRYLFYTTSQVADRFPSNDADGDASFQSAWGEDDYSVLGIIDSIDVSPTDRDRFHPEAGEYAFVYSMRAIAGLYLWFATESGILNRVTVGTSFSDGYVLVDGKPRQSPSRLVLPARAEVRLEAPAQTFTETQTGRSYRMKFEKWTCMSPSGDTWESTENPWETEPPFRASVTAVYLRQVDVVFTEPRHMDGGTGAHYRVNGTDHGTSWSGSLTEGEITPLSVEMILPPGCVFLGWSDGSKENPRSVTPADHLNVHGLYKLHLRAESASAGSQSVRRWIASTHMTGPGENTFVMVYESSGNIYYCGSADGEHWGAEEMVSDGTGNAAHPSIEYVPVSLEGVSGTFIVWEERTSLGDGYAVLGRVRNALDGRWGQIRNISGSVSGPRPGSTPVISSDVVLWKGPEGLLLRRFFDGEAVPVPGTDDGSAAPALDVSPNVTGELTIAWTQGGRDVMFLRGLATGAPWSEPLVISAGTPDGETSGPSIAVDGSGMACVAWTAGNDGKRKIHYRYIDRENILRASEIVSDCPIEGGLPVAPSLTHYRDDETNRRDMDVHCLDPGSGNITTLLIRSGEPIGPVVTKADALCACFPASGKKSAPGNLVIVPAGAGVPPYTFRSVVIAQGMTAPLTPAPLYPPAGAELADTTVEIRWACAPDASMHTVQVAETESFTVPLTVDVPDVAGDRYLVTGLRPGTRYYWRIKGSNRAGESTFTTPVMFSTPARPGAPVLSGTTATYGRAKYPSLSWTIIPGASAYRVLRYFCNGLQDCGSTGRPGTVYLGSATAFIDRYTPVGTKLATGRAWYTVVAEKNGVQSVLSNKISYGISEFIASGNLPEVPDDPGLPTETKLGTNYPNPFNPTTRIRYQLADGGAVKITVFNIIGETVDVLADGEREPGYFETEWDASGRPPGVYILEMLVTPGGKGDTRCQRTKMIYMK